MQNKKVVTTIRMPAEMHAELRAAAFEGKSSINRVMLKRLRGKCVTCGVGIPEHCSDCTATAFKMGEESKK